MRRIELIRREEGRQAIRTAELATEAEAVGGGWMAFAGVGSWANQAAGLGLHGPVSGEEIDRLVRFYVERGVEPKIEVASVADDSVLEALVERGFVLRESEDVLATTLGADEDLEERLPHGMPSGIDVVRVDPADDAQVEAFVAASTVGFREPGPVPDVLASITRRMVRHPASACFLALVEGQPVGGGVVDVGEGVAALLGTSVDPAFRRRGIQQALMVRRLAHARERGASVVVVHSRPGIPTARNAMRLGFDPYYSRMVLAMPRAGLVPSP